MKGMRGNVGREGHKMGVDQLSVSLIARRSSDFFFSELHPD